MSALCLRISAALRRLRMTSFFEPKIPVMSRLIVRLVTMNPLVFALAVILALEKVPLERSTARFTSCFLSHFPFVILLCKKQGKSNGIWKANGQ